MRGPEGRDEDGQTPDSRREEHEGARPTEPDGPRTERSEGPKGRLSDGESTRPSLRINTDSAGQSALAPIRLGCRLAPTSLVPRSAVTRLPSCRTVASPGSERRSHRRPIRPRRRDCRAPAVAETTHFPDVAGTRPARRREGERHVLWR